MSEQLHLDADSLSAFVEGVLPEHERQACLAHLAECQQCREVLFLAQGVVPDAVVAKPVFVMRRRWSMPVPVLAAAALLIAVLGLTWYLERSKVAPETVALVTTPATIALPAMSAPVKPQLRANKEAVRAKPKNAPIVAKPVMDQASAPPIVNSPVRSAAPQPVGTTAPETLVVNGAVASSTIPVPAPSIKDMSSEDGLARIAGTVIDPAGAVVPRAAVTLRRLTDSIRTETRADAEGQFAFPGLAAGQYELQISSPGFRVTTMKVAVEPRQIASLRPELAVGSASETVEVSALASTIQTESSSLGARSKKANPPEPRPLPSKLAVSVNITSGKIILALDSASALYVSRNSGKSWQAVKPVWKGKVDTIRLTDPPQPKTSLFELTTDSGALWFSRDGSRWHAASATH